MSSSKPTILASDVLGPLLLEALDGFLLIINNDGIIEFVSENVESFLNYTQNDMFNQTIYNYIHPLDQPRLSSNLLPLNALTSTNTSASSSSSSSSTAQSPQSSHPKSRTFNARFIIKSSLNESESQCSYENMQISCVLVPQNKSSSHSPSQPSTSQQTVESELSEQQCGVSLVCVARRIPQSEKSSSNLIVEQFTTKLDFTGKILSIDTSG